MFEASNFIEGEKVINYRIVTCPICQHAQKIEEKKIEVNASTAKTAIM